MMQEYIVYFELCGKKMKTTVQANSEQAARGHIASKLIFHSVAKKQPTDYEDFTTFMDGDTDMGKLFNTLFKK
jgi:hypothetical protein